MRLLQISNYYYPHIGGIEQVVRDIADAANQDGMEQKIICFNEDAANGRYICHRRDTVREIVDGIEIVRCGCCAKISSQSISLNYAAVLEELLEDFHPDVVIFHFPNPFVAHFLLNDKKHPFKLIVLWHLDITKQKILKRLFHGQTIRLLKRADKIVTHTPNYVKGSPYLSMIQKHVDIIPDCIRTERFVITEEITERVNKIREEKGERILCFGIGRHVPYKGFSTLIDAARYVDKHIVIVIGGKGPITQQLTEQAKDQHNISFAGRLSDVELLTYYLACDIFVFPSITKNEAFGLALVEGMYFGKPAVSYTIPGSGVNYVNLDRVTGIECPNRDSKAYAQAINELAQNQQLRNLYGQNAYKRVKENFMFETFKNSWLEEIKMCMEREGREECKNETSNCIR